MSARTNIPVELQPFVVPNVRLTGKELGVGSYGSVEEAEIQGATCVVKKLHDALLPPPTEDHGADDMIQTFVRECRLMSTLRHPHIVQFLGVCFLTGSRLPALIMEKLMTDHHSFLESNKDIPLAMKRTILVDVAKGLTYLHSHNPPVIHRDLTARNVLLNSAMVAKIADLGNSRIINVGLDHFMTMTKTPGNACYMPPEALEEHSQYNAKIDIFSFGNLTLFTLTETFPKVKNATYVHPTTRRTTARSEIERRSVSMDQISQVFGRLHPLVQLAETCLQDDPRNRPSIATVLQRLESCSLVPYRSWDANKLEMVKDTVGKERQIEILQQQQQQMLLKTSLGKDSRQSQQALQSSKEREHILEQRAQEAERRIQAEYKKRREAEEITRQLQVLADASERREQEATARAQQYQRQTQEAERNAEEATARAQQYQRQAQAERTAEEATARAQQYQRQAQEAERNAEEATARAQHDEREAGKHLQEIDSQWVVQRNEIQLTDEELGRGAWADVKMAIFRGTRVAAKCFYPQIISPYNRPHFRREIIMASRIRHPNLVQFIGATLQGEMIILMELMPTSLRRVLEQTAISHNEITSISLDIARALNYLHLMQPDPIVHCDIRSVNIFLEPGSNNSWKVKVWGDDSMSYLYQLIDRDADIDVVPDSFIYTAPEAHYPDQHSPKMDIFSFGVLLIEMCTAHYPVVSERETHIQSIPHAHFVALIRCCLNVHKDNRPSASDLITELQPWPNTQV